jgi:hypothetical protein
MRALPAVMVLGASVGALLAGCDTATESTDDIDIPHLDAAPPGTVLFYDDFDTENGRRGENNWTSFVHWVVVDGCVDLHGNGFYDVQRGNGLYVDLDGTCMAGGTIETRTSFTLEPGSYVLEYWLAGNQRIDAPDTVHVSLGTLYHEEFVLPRDQPFTLIQRTVEVTSTVSAALRFRNFGGDDQGALLDVVRLRRGEG